jgi:hypothetical protein
LGTEGYTWEGKSSSDDGVAYSIHHIENQPHCDTKLFKVEIAVCCYLLLRFMSLTIVDICEVPDGLELLVVELRVLEDCFCLVAGEIAIDRVHGTEDVPVLALLILGNLLPLCRRHPCESLCLR